MLLAIAAFSLSLIGTFLVRSGVLTSVHAFAVDPQRGLFILVFLLLVIGGSLLLFLVRAPTLQTTNNPRPLSRESALLLNNVFLVVMMLTVLMGTAYPLIIDGLGLGKLSVGAPYFNTVFIPLMLPMLFLMGIGIHLRWHQDQWRSQLARVNIPLVISIVISGVLLWCTTSSINHAAWLGLGFAFWVLLNTGSALYKRTRDRGIGQIGQAYWGMILAHCGVAVTVIGIAISTNYGQQDDVQMSPGKQTNLAGYHITMLGEVAFKGQIIKALRHNFKFSITDKVNSFTLRKDCIP